MSEPMFTLYGKVANVYHQAGGVSKKTGDIFDPRDKVQILGQIPNNEGGHKLDLVTLNVENSKDFTDQIGQNVRVPVGFFATGKNVVYFIPRGSEPSFDSV